MGEAMKIIITGASGFIGSYVVNHLRAAHATVYPLISPRQGPVNGSITCDLSNSVSCKEVCAALVDAQPDVMIHLANRVCTSENRLDVKLLTDNLAITQGAISVATALKPKVFIHASSMAVYPNCDGTYTEAALPHPAVNGDGLYGLAKFLSEEMIDFYLRSLMTVTHVRLTQVYGSGLRPDRIFPMMVQEVRKNNTITVFGEGERITNFIHIEDVARAIDAVIKAPQAGIYNVSCHDHLTLLQWAQQIALTYGNAQTSLIKESKGARIKQYIDGSRFENTFNVCLKTIDVKGF